MFHVFLMAFLVSFPAFAFHPNDHDSLQKIGTGTELVVVKDINVKPRVKSIGIGGACDLVLKHATNFDRVLAEGTVLKVTDTASTRRRSDYDDYYSTYIVFVKVDNPNIQHIECVTKFTDPTIGQLKSTKKFQINLADPVRI